MYINPLSATLAAIAVRTPFLPGITSAGPHTQDRLPYDAPLRQNTMDAASPLARFTVVSQSSTTSVDGSVTTVTLYADGSSETTTEGGDTVAFSYDVAA